MTDITDTDVIIGGTIKHNGHGYGFKITYINISNIGIDEYKQWIIDYHRLKGLNVQVERGYHDTKNVKKGMEFL